MNAKQYAEYESSVAAFLNRNAVKPGCHSPKDCEHGEPFFSWSACECCGSRLGGNRETYTFATEPTFETFDADICADCVYYLTYGVLDDMTMLDIAAQVQTIRASTATPKRELARSFNVSESNVRLIVSGATWKHLR